MILNIVLGVMFDNFSSAKQHKNNIIISQEILKWKDIQNKILLAKPFSYSLPRNGFRLSFFKLSRNKFYRNFIKIILILNMFRFCFVLENISNQYQIIYIIFLYFLVIIFLSEYLFKILSFGLLGYYQNRIFIFENVVLIGLLSELANYQSNYYSNSNNYAVIKLLKYLSIFRFIYSVKGIKNILNALSFSFPLLLNLVLLEFIILFVYANIGYYAFGSVLNGEIIGNQINFSNLVYSFFTLFKCLTCDDWYNIMFDCIQYDSYSIKNSSGI